MSRIIGYQVYCFVCNSKIGFYGFPNHVRKHKKELGEDIYVKKRIERSLKNGKRKKVTILRGQMELNL